MVQKIYPNYAPGDFTKWSFHNMRLGEVFRPYLLEVLAVSKRLFHSRLGNVQMTCKKVCSQKRKGLHHDQCCWSQGGRGGAGVPHTLRCQINESNQLSFLDFFPQPTRLFGPTRSHFPPFSGMSQGLKIWGE